MAKQKKSAKAKEPAKKVIKTVKPVVVDNQAPSLEIPVHTEGNPDASPVTTAEQKNGDAPADENVTEEVVDLHSKSFSELKTIAEEKGIDLKGLNSAAKLIEAITGNANGGDDLYHVTITMNDQDYKASTDNLRDALLALNPPTIKTKVFFKVEHKGKTVEKLLFVPQARRVFLNKLSAEFFAVNIIKTLNLK